MVKETIESIEQNISELKSLIEKLTQLIQVNHALVLANEIERQSKKMEQVAATLKDVVEAEAKDVFEAEADTNKAELWSQKWSQKIDGIEKKIDKVTDHIAKAKERALIMKETGLSTDTDIATLEETKSKIEEFTQEMIDYIQQQD